MMRALMLMLLVMSLLRPVDARAAESTRVVSARATASLVSDSDTYTPGRPLRLGLWLRLAPGWHSYWSNPGDAGAAPTVAFELPAGGKAGALKFPAPTLMREAGLASFAYTGSVLLPVTVTLTEPGPAVVVAHADWLACASVCVPEHGDFRLTLAAGTPAPDAEAGLFAEADRLSPQVSPFAARISPDGQLTVSGPALGAGTVRDAFLFPDTAGVIDQAADQALALDDGRLVLRLKAAAPRVFDGGLAGVLALTDRGGERSWYRIAATPGPAAAGGLAATGLVASLGLALLGGLVLNLMPCVFPVLAMKAVALSRLAGSARREVRIQAGLYSAGVVGCFVLLGGLMLGLRRVTGFAGWGAQFQSPLFVTIIAWVLFAVGLALSGASDGFGSRFAGVGQGVAARGGRVGALATGGLAVLVATPCTAPFMATALAVAFAAPLPAALGIFLCLGLGLAAPTLLLAGVPALAGLMPRPGGWMEVLRQALAFPMFAAALWLVWVLGREAGPNAVLAAGSGALLIALAAWLLGCSAGARPGWRRLGMGLALGSVGMLGALLVTLGGPAAATVAGQEPFSTARLAALRAEGRPVFIDLTADWCLTCMVNERVALSPASVRAAFAAHDVAYLRGDWTRSDPEITRFLQQAGRQGVPLYLLYPKGSGEAVVLPQILTAAGVLRALGDG